MTNKIVSVLLGMFLFLLPTANATSFTSSFTDNEFSNYIDNLTMNTTEATYGQSIDVGLTTKKSFDHVSLLFSNGTKKDEVSLVKTSDNYYSGKVNITSSFVKGVYQLTSIKLDEQDLAISDKMIKFSIVDLPAPTIEKMSNKSTTIKGVFLPNSQVQISKNNIVLKTVSTNSNGEYAYAVKPIKAGTKITVIGLSNDIKSQSTTIAVSDLIAPSVSSISTVSDQSQYVTGKSEAYANVKVYNGSKLIGKSVVTSYGKFNVKIAKQKANTVLKVITIDKSNNQSNPFSVRVIDRTAPSVPSISSLKENATIITGKTEPKATVKLYINNGYTAKTTSNSIGTYSFKVSKLKAYTSIKVTSQDLAGNQSKPATFEVQSNQPISNGQLIIINTQSNKLSYYNKGKLVKTFSVATGKSSTPTPTGKFKILNKIKNRPWYKENIPGGDPRNPLGKRWMGLSVGDSPGSSYGIHGNNKESSIGQHVSNGCIRMHNSEIAWLFEQVKTGTTVIIAKSSNSNGKIAHSYGISITA